MNISTASRVAGLPVKTARYYADIGLVSAPFRSESGYRIYDGSAVRSSCSSAGRGSSGSRSTNAGNC